MHSRNRRIAFVFLLVLGLVWIYLSKDSDSSTIAGRVAAPQQDFLAPDFTLNTSGGETIRLADLRGQAILVNLWATWCPPCREEMQSIETIYQAYRDEGFTVLAVNMTYQDNPERVLPFVQEQDLTFPILLDITGEMAHTYQMRSLPSSYFIRRDGTIDQVVIGGPMSEALLRARVEAILE